MSKCVEKVSVADTDNNNSKNIKGSWLTYSSTLHTEHTQSQRAAAATVWDCPLQIWWEQTSWPSSWKEPVLGCDPAKSSGAYSVDKVRIFCISGLWGRGSILALSKISIFQLNVDIES